MIKFAYTSSRGRVCFFYQNDLIVMQKVQFEFRCEKIYGPATCIAFKEVTTVITVITSTYNLPLPSLYFVYNKQTRLRFPALANFFIRLPP